MSALARIQPDCDEYLEFCAGVARLTGIDLTQYKRGQMERRVRSFAELRGTPDLAGYLTVLSADPAQLELFLDRMTINVSQLWRNPGQFALLADTVIPQLAEAGRVRCWSAGCSYGAEAYTLAAICAEAAPGARIEIHGTDIDARMIERARAGRFSAADVRSAPPEQLERWFRPAADGCWEAAPALRMMVRFATGDLLADRFPSAAYDLVLCRNVVIYFTEDVRDRLHARLAGALRVGGYLMTGSSERISSPAAAGLEATAPFIYRRAA
jgi:chemotaxis protein methyltransferase CheR